jgi:glucose-1-phosphate thymidylyltransferase
MLIASGIREICLISTPADIPRFQQLFGDGSQWGISIEFREQPKPEGIAQAFLIAETFIQNENICLILGDNIFFGGSDFPDAVSSFQSGATIFAYHVNDPERYGVVDFGQQGKAISLEEKPKKPKSNYAVPGVYIYDRQVVSLTKGLKPSRRNELEITDLNRCYLDQKELKVHRLSRGFAWLDAGTSTNLHEASAFVHTIEKRQGVKIGWPEEAALRRGFLGMDQFESLMNQIPNCEYREYLINLCQEFKRLGTWA